VVEGLDVTQSTGRKRAKTDPSDPAAATNQQQGNTLRSDGHRNRSTCAATDQGYKEQGVNGATRGQRGRLAAVPDLTPDLPPEQVSGSAHHSGDTGDTGDTVAGQGSADAKVINDLMADVASGDHDAFAALYDQTCTKVFGLVRRVVRDSSQAEEVTQEVYLQAWRQSARFDRQAGTALSWLLTLAHRRAVDRVRSAQASTTREQRAAERDVDRPHDEVSEAVEQRLDAEQVRRCLEGLTTLQRESVTLAYYQGFTYAEVGTNLGVPLGTIKTRMRDGLIRLRDCLGVAM